MYKGGKRERHTKTRRSLPFISHPFISRLRSFSLTLRLSLSLSMYKYIFLWLLCKGPRLHPHSERRFFMFSLLIFSTTALESHLTSKYIVKYHWKIVKYILYIYKMHGWMVSGGEVEENCVRERGNREKFELILILRLVHWQRKISYNFSIFFFAIQWNNKK